MYDIIVGPNKSDVSKEKFDVYHFRNFENAYKFIDNIYKKDVWVSLRWSNFEYKECTDDVK